jgi:transketolase
MVHRALEAADLLRRQGVHIQVVNISSLKPLDVERITSSARKTGAVVTAEDHNIQGGLGGAVAEVLCETHPVPLVRVGVADIFAESGEPDDLARKYGLMPEQIAAAVHTVIQKKQALKEERGG